MCKAIQELIEMGRNEGRNEGEATGEQRMVFLMQILLDSSQTSEIKRAIEDEKYRKKLYKKYHL